MQRLRPTLFAVLAAASIAPPPAFTAKQLLQGKPGAAGESNEARQPMIRAQQIDLAAAELGRAVGPSPSRRIGDRK